MSRFSKFRENSVPLSGADMQMAVESSLDPRSSAYRQAVKLTPATLAHYRTGGKWIPAEHLLYVASLLAHEISKGDARIIVEMPPRHGKSELISINTPIWFLEKYPWANVILTSYGADLAAGFGRQVRDVLLENPLGILDVRIRDDVQRTSLFLTEEGGGMMSAGIGGTITGRGAHLLIVDDYVKNWEEANSTVTQESIWNWWRSTAYNRLEPGGSVVILATRWAQNDLIGRILAEDQDKMWTVVKFPALATANDLLNREVGQSLWAARYDEKKLAQIRNVVGTFIFEAMYQQNPKPLGDQQVDVEQFRIVDTITAPHTFRWVRSWDLAATGEKKRKGDWTVGSLLGTDGKPGSPFAQTVIAHMHRGRWEPAEVERNMRLIAEHDTPGVPIVIEQEPGASGKAYAQHLATNVLRGFAVQINPATKNKWIRAQPYVAAVTHGRIQLLKAAWNAVHKEEVKNAPNAVHDDTLDSVSQGYNYLHISKSGEATWGRDKVAVNAGVNQPIDSSHAPDFDDDFYKAAQGSSLVTGVVFGRRRR